MLAVGDGALGFWAALREVWPETRTQRCWVHKVANVLAALAKSQHPSARRMLAEIRDAEDRDHAVRAVDAFAHEFAAKWPKAVAKIVDDLDVLLAFFDFPAEHWIHLKSTNPIWVFQWVHRSEGDCSLRSGEVTGPDSERDWRVSPLISRCRAGDLDGGVGEPGLKGAWELNPDVPVPRPRCHHRRPRNGGAPWTRRGLLQASTRTSTPSQLA